MANPRVEADNTVSGYMIINKMKRPIVAAMSTIWMEELVRERLIVYSLPLLLQSMGRPLQYNI
ncbi:hypothetical protein PBN151_4512 [Paenibacillus sp. NAIST15-1]|nr:hypothetical protein PBN151_4512 [Paenibacillus sp. NAIST15-1]